MATLSTFRPPDIRRLSASGYSGALAESLPGPTRRDASDRGVTRIFFRNIETAQDLHRHILTTLFTGSVKLLFQATPKAATAFNYSLEHQ